MGGTRMPQLDNRNGENNQPFRAARAAAPDTRNWAAGGSRTGGVVRHHRPDLWVVGLLSVRVGADADRNDAAPSLSSRARWHSFRDGLMSARDKNLRVLVGN